MFCRASIIVLVCHSVGLSLGFKELHYHPSHLMKLGLRALRSDPLPTEAYARDIRCNVDMIGISGDYHYKSDGDDEMCVAYFLANVDEIVELEFKNINFVCDGTTILQWFDGWSMGSGAFPAISDHPQNFSERVQTVCPENGQTLVYRASQNAAMITFQFNRGNSFTVNFKPRKVAQPCNVMATEPTGIFTIRNYGEKKNCSFSIIYPSKINILDMHVGPERDAARLKCADEENHAEFLAGNGLDTEYMRQEEVLCGSAGGNYVHGEDEDSPAGVVARTSTLNLPPTQNAPELCTRAGISIPLDCQNSVVRLVSDEGNENSVTFEYRRTTSRKNDCDF